MFGVHVLGQMPLNCRRSASAAAVGLALVLMHLAVVDGLSYFCLFPQDIRPGSDFTLSVTLFKSGCTTLNAAIVDVSSGSIMVNKTETVVVSPVKGKLNTLIKLQIPLIALEPSYRVNISGTGALKFSNSSIVNVRQKSISILIQTDKALYKPGQKVLFRVVTIYPNMKPYKDTMDIIIYDKDRNRIAQWLHEKSDQGVFSGELTLSDLTPLGTWTIQVNTNVDAASKTFDVVEYVLPKYDVDVNLPSFYLLNVNKPQLQLPLHFTVSARYTYGQPVKGVAKLTAKVLTLDTTRHFTWMKSVILVDGTASVEIPLEQLSSIAPNWMQEKLFNGTQEAWTLLNRYSIMVTADVTEMGTGVTFSDNATVTCYKEKYDLSFLDITPNSFKRGLNYTGYLELKQKDGSAPILSDIKSQDGKFREITVTVTTEEPFWFLLWRGCTSMVSFQKRFPLTPSGHVQFDFEFESNCSQTIEATFLDISTNTELIVIQTIRAFASKADLGIQVTLANVEPSIKPGDVARLKVQTTVPVTFLYYTIMSKGTIIISQMISYVNSASYIIRLNVNRELAQTLAPSARCVVWFVADNNEIISDSTEFNIDGAFANNVSVEFNEDKVEPGANVSLTVHGSPNSTAYMLAVDQSVLLLQGGNDITQKMVLDDLKYYEDAAGGRINFGFFWPILSDGTDSTEVFKDALLQFMTDGYIHATDINERSLIPMPVESGSSPSPAIAVRQNFPETWFFEETLIGPAGNGSINVVAPDTMTSWIASGFAVSDKDGLGIAPLPSKLTVFRPFFALMTLPYSVNRGEEFALKVTIFNYLSTDLKVQVLLKASTFFNVHLQRNIVMNTDVTNDIQVPTNDAVTVVFWINATTVGQIPIEVWAYAGVAGDAERRMLLVTPEGIQQQYSTSMLINLSKGGNGLKTTLNVTLPSTDLVPDSARCMITLIGDIMGSTLTGMDKLIQMPYGCGEQTMLNLAPNVFVLDYLNSTGALTPAIDTKCKGYILSGYQRELTFQRNDGSFSAFGNDDFSGSVWLSAFVVLTFEKAKPYLAVDDVKIAITLTWIIQHQNDSGSFAEPPNGRVIHTDMQGGSSKGTPLTAYVLIALLKNRDNTVINKKLLEESISKARVYLEMQLDSITDPYSLCIISYALVLAKSSKANLALSKRDALAIVENDLKHWEQIDPLVATNTGSFVPPYKQSSAINIEMTAYALLTYVLQNDGTGSLPVAKWLIAQRNPNGGFVSTQDTCMAIEALARFGAMVYGSRSSFNLHVTALIGSETHAFEPVTSQNILTLQIWEPKAEPGTVHLTATGVGTCLVQMSVIYYVHKVDESKGFSLMVEAAVEDEGNTVVVKTCTRWTRKDRNCGMALETVQLLSGFEFVSWEEVGNISGLIKKVETDPSSVNIYYDTIGDVAICVSVKTTRVNVVNNLKKATVKVIEYYNPGNLIVGTYGMS